jgi:hypothetical protein
VDSKILEKTYTRGGEGEQSGWNDRLELSRGIACFVVLLDCDLPTGRLTSEKRGLQSFDYGGVLIREVILADPGLRKILSARYLTRSNLFTHRLIDPFAW